MDVNCSQYNSEIFDDLNPLIAQANSSIDAIKQDIDTLKKSKEKISLVREKLILKIDSLKDEFAEIKREINDEQLDADSYVSDQKKLVANNEKIAKLKESLKSKDRLCSAIKKDLLIAMSEEFSDMPAIVEDYYLNEGGVIKQYCTDTIYAKMSQKIEEGYKEMLGDDTPNVISISYHGKPLSKHSLGQRASALILFILTQHDSDVIVVDQPEDDLDNQVIYEELIQTIKKEKSDMQFIFATHNANIPVLGDAERVVTTEYHEDGSIGIKCRTIDSAETHRDIVNIMEGGEEAFKKRNQIYESWE